MTHILFIREWMGHIISLNNDEKCWLIVPSKSEKVYIYQWMINMAATKINKSLFYHWN